MKSFYELFGRTPLDELFSDWEPRPLNIEDEKWLHFPSNDFLEWTVTFPRYSFDSIPFNAEFKKQPSFLLSQTHRVWLSANLMKRYSRIDDSVVDLGSFPFSIPLAFRDFFKHRGAIISTVIQPISKEIEDILAHYEIAIDSVDLDPYVVDHCRKNLPALPKELTVQDNTQDLVSMFHVLEHLYHPMDALKEANRILKIGGYVVITTDNAMMLNTLENYVSGYGYIFEPVKDTAAMTVHDWRGHVRFYTYNDLVTMLDASGFDIIDSGFNEVFYNIIHSDYFVEPRPIISNWKKNIIKNYPQFSNDIWIVGVKR